MTDAKANLKRVRLVSQGAAFACVGLAGLVAAMGLPGLRPPARPVVPNPFEPANAAATNDPGSESSSDDPSGLDDAGHDSSLILAMLSSTRGAPLPPEPEQPEDDPEPIEPATSGSQTVGSDGVRFVGSLGSRAVLVIDGRQRLLGVGREIGDVRLLELHPTHVIVEIRGQRERIDRPSDQQAPRVVKADAPAAMPSANNPGASGATPVKPEGDAASAIGKPLSPEAIRRIEESRRGRPTREEQDEKGDR